MSRDGLKRKARMLVVNFLCRWRPGAIDPDNVKDRVCGG
jgi:hypothetical protein